MRYSAQNRSGRARTGGKKGKREVLISHLPLSPLSPDAPGLFCRWSLRSHTRVNNQNLLANSAETGSKISRIRSDLMIIFSFHIASEHFCEKLPETSSLVKLVKNITRVLCSKTQKLHFFLSF